ncbi:338L [Invertebrate iridescent virus 6]|uniref:338L n=1 Tax=Invertebrate iridescent virus 6 TaxID=176652 RepID=Q91FI6_IIV6|nr:338L [Invertebrate iridescent virus 6]AAK82198.1 338L [Invertebrate iridescent virus 6]QMS79664.1 hypothetical protein IIV6-T1_331 [Invertebrate iridescent virus 6]
MRIVIKVLILKEVNLMIGIMDGVRVVQVFVQVNANVPNRIQKSAILAMIF